MEQQKNNGQDSQQLGGNIELVGFSDIDRSSMIVVKKIVGSFTRKVSDSNPDFEKIKITIKPIHSNENTRLNKLHAQVIIKGASINAEAEDRNLFVCLDSVLKKLGSQLNKE
ncbi:MAG: hypothetical protein V1740_05130 [Candidatus Woesearchaeota archaeon]